MIRIGDFRLQDEERKAIQSVVESDRVSEGPETRRFERRFAEYIGDKHCVMLSSGTAALITGLTCMKYDGIVNAGDSVLTTPLTYIATSNSIVLSGLKPAYVDVDMDTFCMDVECAAEFVETNECKLAVPVHLMGYAADVQTLMDMGVSVFEDSAQAHGSKLNGTMCGSIGIASAFSFYPAHNIQVGEAGAFVTNDDKLANLARRVKANGRMCGCLSCIRDTGKCPMKGSGYDPRFTHDVIGYNFKTTEFMGAIANVQLDRIADIIKTRQDNVKRLNDGLEGVSYIKTPLYRTDVSYLGYPLVVRPSSKRSREWICQYLESKGIETRPLFGCIPTQQPSFSHLKNEYDGKLPNAEYLGANAFYIGCHQFLTENDIDYMIAEIRRCEA